MKKKTAEEIKIKNKYETASRIHIPPQKKPQKKGQKK